MMESVLGDDNPQAAKRPVSKPFIVDHKTRTIKPIRRYVLCGQCDGSGKSEGGLCGCCSEFEIEFDNDGKALTNKFGKPVRGRTNRLGYHHWSRSSQLF
jgi:hypothetical protein